MPRRRRPIGHNHLCAAIAAFVGAATWLGDGGWSSLTALSVLTLWDADPLRDWHDAGGPDL